MRWTAKNLGAGAIQAIGGILAIGAGAALVAPFLALPTTAAVLVVLLVAGISLLVLGTIHRSRPARTARAARAPSSRSEGMGWQGLADELRRQREVVREHYVELEQIIGPRPRNPRARTGPPIYVPRTGRQSEPHRYVLDATVTPRYIVDQLNGSTSVRAKAIVNEYVGAWMRVGGEVADIMEPAADGLMVNLVVREPERALDLHDVSVFAYFDPEWRDRAIRLPKGATVSIVGRVAGASADLGGSVSLEHAEIMSQPESTVSKARRAASSAP